VRADEYVLVEDMLGRGSELNTWILGGAGDEEKWLRTLARHLQPGDIDVETRTESSDEIPRGVRFKVDRLDDLLCLPILRAVLVLCRGVRKIDNREELCEAADSPDNDMAWARNGRNGSRKLRKDDGPFRIMDGESCAESSMAEEAGGDMCCGACK
jgi:hypothetical protein